MGTFRRRLSKITTTGYDAAVCFVPGFLAGLVFGQVLVAGFIGIATATIYLLVKARNADLVSVDRPNHTPESLVRIEDARARAFGRGSQAF